MTQPQGEPHFVKSDWDSITGIRRFSYEAMATTFEVIILHEDARYAEAMPNRRPGPLLINLAGSNRI
jgi:hypothetical protein